MSLSKTIDAETLQAEILRRKYIELLENPDVFPSTKNWEYIIANTMSGEIGRLLYRKYLVALLTPTPDRVDSHLAAIREFPRYLDAISHEDAVETIYSDVSSYPDETIKLIKKCRLFSALHVSRLISDKNYDMAFQCLSVFKPSYSATDLWQMKALLRQLRQLPEVGRVEESRGVFKNAFRYVCPNGHINNPDDEYCSRPDCGLNIRGLTATQAAAIEAFANIVDVLDDLFRNEDSQQM